MAKAFGAGPSLDPLRVYNFFRVAGVKLKLQRLGILDCGTCELIRCWWLQSLGFQPNV